MNDKKLIEQTYSYLESAQEYYGRRFRLDAIRTDLKGKNAGYFRVQRNGHALINYNPELYQQYAEDFLLRTVPHEVAHLVAYQEFGRKIRPHGQEWKNVMRLFGADIRRCHNYDVAEIQSRQYRTFSYHCDCMEHTLTAIRHNRIKKGQIYQCKKCRQPLVPAFR